MKKSILFVFIIAGYFINHIIAEENCPERNRSAHHLYFQNEPEVKKAVKECNYFELHCCMDGFKYLIWKWWSFENKEEEKIHDAEFRDENRTIAIKEPYFTFTTGYFTCIGTDAENHTLNGSTFVYVFREFSDRNLTIIQPHYAPRINYQTGDNAVLTCRAQTNYPDDQISVTWQISGSPPRILNNTNKYNINTTYYRNYKGNLFCVFVETNLTINSLTLSDSSNYTCVFSQMSNVEEFPLKILVQPVFSVKIMGLTIGFATLSAIITVVVWRYIYRLIVFYKTYLDCYPQTLFENKLKFDVSIFHPENDESCIWLARQMCHSLESRNYQCWLMERDKSMGQEIRLSMQEIAHKSSLLLIIMSPTVDVSLNQSDVNEMIILRSLLALQSGLAIKKLYIFNPSYKVFRKYIRQEAFQLSLSLQTELKIQRFCCLPSYKNIDVNSVRNSQNGSSDLTKAYEYYIEWIGASLPTNVLRRVKKQDL